MNLRPLAIAITLAVGLSACNNSNAPTAAVAPVEQADPAETAKQLEKLYADYWEANLKLNPINATFIGDTRYNDQLPNFLTADFRKQIQRRINRAAGVCREAEISQARNRRRGGSRGNHDWPAGVAEKPGR